MRCVKAAAILAIGKREAHVEAKIEPATHSATSGVMLDNSGYLAMLFIMKQHRAAIIFFMGASPRG